MHYTTQVAMYLLKHKILTRYLLGHTMPKNAFGDLGGLVLLTASGVLAGWVSSAVRCIFEGLLRLLMLERTYTDLRNRGGIEALLATLEETHSFAERRDARGNGSTCMTVAGVIVGPLCQPYIAFVNVNSDTKNMHSHKIVRIRVLRPRWLGPLLPDSVANGIDEEGSDGKTARKDGTIRVMRQSGLLISALEWQTRRELACPSFVPAKVRDAAEAVAQHLEQCARESPGRQARIVLTGTPGIGKTTATRLLAMRLGAVLVPTFDPTRPGASMQGILCDLGHHGSSSSSIDTGKWAVIVIEEFDGCLRRLRPASSLPDCQFDADASAHGVRTEVVDKASWTAMLDMLQYAPRVVLVMTSNETPKEIELLDLRAGGALLRDGRVTERFDFHSFADVEDVSGKNGSQHSSLHRRVHL
jgi:hypothetical protein